MKLPHWMNMPPQLMAKNQDRPHFLVSDWPVRLDITRPFWVFYRFANRGKSRYRLRIRPERALSGDLYERHR